MVYSPEPACYTVGRRRNLYEARGQAAFPCENSRALPSWSWPRLSTSPGRPFPSGRPARPSLLWKNLKSLSQIYHISLDELLGEGKLPEPKAPPEDQPPVQPPQEEPKEKQTVEKVLHPRPQAPTSEFFPFVALGVVAALLLGLVAFLWWWNLPAQQFSYWHKTPSERPTQGGLCFVVDTITVNADGSGNISYILYNNEQR